jgi:hypothetical protein
MADERRRGFAGMNQERQRQIASQGGRAAHQKGTAHEFTPAEAREAGRKGGEAVSRNREHMSQIGRRGGESSHGRGGGASSSRSAGSSGDGSTGHENIGGGTTGGEGRNTT